MSCSRASGDSPAAEGEPGEEGLDLEELARLRQGAYRLLGAALLYPDGTWTRTLPPLARGLREETRPFSSFPFWAPWERLLGALEGLGGGDPRGLQGEYLAHFGGAGGAGGASPCESGYLPRGAAAGLMAELEGEYARGGFSLAPFSSEAPDHAAVELEFMSALCGREAEAWGRGDPREAVGQLERQRGFLLGHLSQWFPAFARAVAERGGDGFYALALGAAQAYLAHEGDLIPLLIGRYREVAAP